MPSARHCSEQTHTGAGLFLIHLSHTSLPAFSCLQDHFFQGRLGPDVLESVPLLAGPGTGLRAGASGCGRPHEWEPVFGQLGGHVWNPASFSRGVQGRGTVTSPVESVEGGFVLLGRASVERSDPGPWPCPCLSLLWERERAARWRLS